MNQFTRPDDPIDYVVYLGVYEDLRMNNLKTPMDALAHWKRIGSERTTQSEIKRWRIGEPIKLAICISGFMRNYKLLYQSENFQKLVKNHDADIYISTWDIVGYGSCSSHGLDYGLKLDVAEVRKLTPNLKRIEVESYKNKEDIFRQDVPGTTILVDEPGTLERVRSQFYKIYRCQKMAFNSDIPYQAVIRMRADLILEHEVDIGRIMEQIYAHKVYITRDPSKRPGVIGDQFAIGNLYTMNIYADLYNELYKPNFVRKGITTICEQLLWEHLKAYRLHIIKMNNRIQLNRTII